MKTMISKSCSLLFLTVVTSCFQQTFGQKLTTGFSSGIVISSIDDNDRLIGEKSKNTGLAVAGVFTLHLSESFGLRTEPGYERKGNTRTIEGSNGQDPPLARTVSSGLIDYFSLPLLAEFAFGKKAKALVHLGPSISYLLKYTQKDVYGVAVTTTETFDHTFAYKRFDFSLLGGAGFLLPLNDKWAVTGDARYFRGLVSLPENTSRPEQRNFGFISRLGLRYVIK